MSRKRGRKERQTTRKNTQAPVAESLGAKASHGSDVSRVDSAFGDDGSAVEAANSETLIEYLPDTQTENRKVSRSPVREKDTSGRSWRYEVVAVLALMLIWIPAVLFLRYAPPIYKSSWTIIIPGTTSGASINLDSLGEANTSVGSQYGGKSIDPKVNYKAIVLSSTVLNKAASMSDMTAEEYGKPKINLVDQTAMMEVITKANDAELARVKAQNLYKAFSDELESLRLGERTIKQNDSLQQLAEYQLAVDQTQDALQQFRMNSELVSIEQYKSLLDTVGNLTESKREMEARLDALNARYGVLVYVLGVDPGVAGSIIKLRQDLMVQSQLRAYAAAHAKMTEEEAILGKKHPKVIHARSRTNLAYQALLERADVVLGLSSKQVLDHFMPSEAIPDISLYSQLIQLQGDKLAIESELQGLEVKLPELREKTLKFADAAAQLEVLERDHQIASTILVSATARLDLGKSDIYASYPMTQLLVPADLPEKPGRLQKLFVLLGAVAGTMMVVLALVILWNRKLWLRLIQKSV